jgi:hypothetical protein
MTWSSSLLVRRNEKHGSEMIAWREYYYKSPLVIEPACGDCGWRRSRRRSYQTLLTPQVGSSFNVSRLGEGRRKSCQSHDYAPACVTPRFHFRCPRTSIGSSTSSKWRSR